MSVVGQREIVTQQGVIAFFRDALDYAYLGHRKDRVDNSNVEEARLAEPMYLTGYIERMGTGTGDMIRRCREAGLPEPDFAVTDGFKIVVRRVPAMPEPPSSPPESRPEWQPESQPESLEVRVMTLLEAGAKSKSELSRALGQQEISGQLNKVVRLLLDDQTIEHTVPERPQSRLQKYRLSTKGKAALEALKRGDPKP